MEQSGNAAGHVLYVADFVECEGAAQHFLFAVREPFLDDEAAAQRAIFFGMMGVLSTASPI